MLWGSTAHCVKLSGEDLSRYSNKIESVRLRKRPHYHYVTESVMSQQQTFLTALAGKQLAWYEEITSSVAKGNEGVDRPG